MEYREKEFDEIVDILRPKYNEDGWLDSELVNETIKAFKKLKLNLPVVSRSLPTDTQITSEIEKLGMQKLLDSKGIYTSEKLHIDIYKHAFKKAQEPSDNG
jgi:hypothetical protein